MELNLQQVNNTRELIIPEKEIIKTANSSFIEANTIPVSLSHLKNDCIVPIYANNEAAISHQDFITSMQNAINNVMPGIEQLQPDIRVSHEIKGRVASAQNKTKEELLPNEITRYFSKMAYIIEIPDIDGEVNGNKLNLTVGGVKSFSLDNLYTKRTLERFKIFVGLKNKVCLNMSVWTSGLLADVRVSSANELQNQMEVLLANYQVQSHLNSLKALTNYKLNSKEFATLLGKMRLYQYLPKNEKMLVPQLMLNDGQISNIAKQYFNDKNFCRDENGDISLYNIYNLLTGSNKSSYIENFLERASNAFEVTQQLSHSLEHNQNSWYLN